MSDRKAIFITGGAGGMGLATGKLFAEKGWFVGLFDLDEDLLGAARDEISSDAVMTMKLDVTREADFGQAVDLGSVATTIADYDEEQTGEE